LGESNYKISNGKYSYFLKELAQHYFVCILPLSTQVLKAKISKKILRL